MLPLYLFGPTRGTSSPSSPSIAAVDRPAGVRNTHRNKKGGRWAKEKEKRKKDVLPSNLSRSI